MLSAVATWRGTLVWIRVESPLVTSTILVVIVVCLSTQPLISVIDCRFGRRLVIVSHPSVVTLVLIQNSSLTVAARADIHHTRTLIYLSFERALLVFAQQRGLIL